MTTPKRSLHSILAREITVDEVEKVTGAGFKTTGTTEYDTFDWRDTSPRTDYDVGGDVEYDW